MSWLRRVKPIFLGQFAMSRFLKSVLRTCDHIKLVALSFFICAKMQTFLCYVCRCRCKSNFCMAGSKKWFVYTTDFGSDFAILLDESNTEAVNAGTQDFPDDGPLVDALPRNIRPRRAVYANAAGTRVISCVCLTQAIYTGVVDNASSITDPIAGTGSLSLIRLEPEKRRLPRGQDTGLTDGDAT